MTPKELVSFMTGITQKINLEDLLKPNKKMDKSDDIDILLTLNPNGWSSCLIIIDNKTYGLDITHVFSDPFLDLIQALSNLVKGANEVAFYFFGEPGGQRININKIQSQQDKVKVTIDEFTEPFFIEPKNYVDSFAFEIKLKQLVTIFYLQLQKTYLLLRDKQFSKNRAMHFPFQEFIQFEKLIKQFLEL